jgi:hypothetical protein
MPFPWAIFKRRIDSFPCLSQSPPLNVVLSVILLGLCVVFCFGILWFRVFVWVFLFMRLYGDLGVFVGVYGLG